MTQIRGFYADDADNADVINRVRPKGLVFNKSKSFKIAGGLGVTIHDGSLPTTNAFKQRKTNSAT